MPTLTEKQQNDLQLAILEYLQSQNYNNAAEAFITDANLPHNPPDSCGDKSKITSIIPLLERKWTSIVRLSKKVTDLEKQLSRALSNIDNNGIDDDVDLNTENGNTNNRLKRALPTDSSIVKTLTGHRGVITSTACHPTFTLLASSSEDGTIKIWDLESGSFERTLKGHSNSVNSVNFSNDGNLLASASMDLSIKIWGIKQDYKCIRTLNGEQKI